MNWIRTLISSERAVHIVAKSPLQHKTKEKADAASREAPAQESDDLHCFEAFGRLGIGADSPQSIVQNVSTLFERQNAFGVEGIKQGANNDAARETDADHFLGRSVDHGDPP
ncbi:MAG: hypothetical protein ACLQFW_07685 [Xanthobacteraceae bacterium]